VILLATGLSKIEEKLENQDMQRCYHRSVLLDIVKETSPEAIVLSPYLDGKEDLLSSIIIPLRKLGTRIIFLPGTSDMPDTREWIKKLLPWGVYCYVFDPVTSEKITYRIQNPGRIPEALTELPEFPDDELPPIFVKSKKSLLEKFLKRDKPERPRQDEQEIKNAVKRGNKRLGQHSESGPPAGQNYGRVMKPEAFSLNEEVISSRSSQRFVEKLSFLKNKETKSSAKKEVCDFKDNAVASKDNIFAKIIPRKSHKTGYIKDGVFIPGKWEDPLEILDNDPDAIVIPASWKEHIKNYKRNIKARTVPLIVIGKSEDADLCVKTITPSVIEDVTALAKRMKELWGRADTDPLTTLYTRNFLKDWMEERETSKKQYSLALIDIDHFKAINDTYGHPVGDQVLIDLANFLKIKCRKSDIVSRYGGEEFIICFPDTPAIQAHKLVERLRIDWIEREVIVDEKVIKSAFSAGIAEWFPGCDVVAQADKLLYQAKNNGRNQVCSTAIDPVPQDSLGDNCKPSRIPDSLDDIINQENSSEAPSHQGLCPIDVCPAESYPVLPNANLIQQNPVQNICPEDFSKVESQVKTNEPYKEINNLSKEYFSDNISYDAKVIAIWNNDGYMKAETALEVARKNKAVLLEYDFINPRLDLLMKVPAPRKEKCMDKTPWEVGAGAMTFGDTLTVETALKLLHQYQEGVNYLPVGNTLDSAAEIPVQTLISLIDNLAQKVVVDLATDMYNELTLAVLQKADLILVPSQKPSGYLKKQVASLRAAGLRAEYHTAIGSNINSSKKSFLGRYLG
jgi:diguanylate cyclase (GGDEF)-like protein